MMYGIQRKTEICQLLKQNGRVDVNGLAERFGISRETIRRDLHELEQQGVLTRTHGGAVPRDTGAPEAPVGVRGVRHAVEKHSICRHAAQYVADGDTVFVDNSSTTAFLARYLPRDATLTVVTNSLGLLLEAAQGGAPSHTYVVLGGVFSAPNLSVSGNITHANADAFYPDKVFFSCTGIHQRSMVADASMQEADVKRMMIARAREVYLLADHTKFSRAGQVFVTGFDTLHAIITDKKAQPESYAYLQDMDVDVQTV